MAMFGPIAAALVEEGCSPEQIAAAVIALERAREREREERLARLREGARLRQQRCRERKRLEARPSRASRCDDEQPPFPLKETSPAPPKENNPQTSGEGAPAPEASRLPAGFEASAEDRAFGAAEGLSAAEIARAIDDLRLWAAEAVGEKARRDLAALHAARRRRQAGEGRSAGDHGSAEAGRRRRGALDPRQTGFAAGRGLVGASSRQDRTIAAPRQSRRLALPK